MELTATCRQCNSTLEVDYLRETDWVVCSQCNSMFALASAADEKPRTSRMAIVSLVLGLASLVGLFILGIPAIILGLRSLVQIRREPVRLKGRGLAITGVVAGTMFSVLGGCVSFVVLVNIPTIRATTQLETCDDRLQEIGDALTGYQADNGSLPPAVSRDKDGRPLLSWRVLILPYFRNRPDLKTLHDQFHLDEPWDSEHNRQLVEEIPETYRCPTDPGNDPTLTHYAAITGPGTVFDDQSGNKWTTDDAKLIGVFLIGEVTSEQHITWTEPKDISIGDYSENSDWLDGGRFGAFDSHHVIFPRTEKFVHFLRVDSYKGHQFPHANPEILGTDEDWHFHFRRRLIVGGHSLKHLALSEVEVVSGGESISPNGTATQSSTLDGAVAGRANDGKTDSGQHAFSRTKLEPYPWWELTFKEPVPVERIVLNKLTDWDPDVRWSLAVKLLDSDRKVLWHETVDGTIPVNQNFTQEWNLSGSDSAKASKPIAARFLRLEFTEPDATETASSQAGPGNKRTTGLPILVEKRGESFYLAEISSELEGDVPAESLRGAELLAIKEYNGKSFQEIRGFRAQDVQELLRGPTGSTITLRIRPQESKEVTEVSLKAIKYNPPVTSPAPTPTPDTP